MERGTLSCGGMAVDTLPCCDPSPIPQTIARVSYLAVGSPTLT